MCKCVDVYEHDFRSRRLCVVPVIISMKNCSWNKRVGFTLEMMSENSESNRSVPHKSSYPTIFHWTGFTLKYALLSPNEEQTFVVKACFAQPGVYDINRWRLAVSLDQDATGQDYHRDLGSEGIKGYVQMPNSPHLLTVVNTPNKT